MYINPKPKRGALAAPREPSVPAEPAQSRSVRGEAYDRLQAVIEEYIDGYTFEGDNGYHQPTGAERILIMDAIQGMLVDDDFITANRALDATAHRSEPSVPAETYRCKTCSALCLHSVIPAAAPNSAPQQAGREPI